MLPSMYSGVSGLLAHQERMNVIGNDIANVNTVGYKQSDVSFKEAYVNTLRSPAPGTPGQQIGLGVQVGHITRDFGGGALMQTGSASNVAVSGNGFFVVADPAAAGQQYFTRAGDFVLDVDAATNQTYLITSEGRRLQGVMTAPGDPVPDLTGADVGTLEDVVLPENTTAYSVALDGTLYVSVDGGPLQSSGRLALANFDNPAGLLAIGSNLYKLTDAAAIRDLANPGEGGTGQLFQGYLENSNVDLAGEFTDMIVTQRGFQANSRTISTSDEMLNELLMLKR
jgi:flagellar hook protein FlgE